MPPSDATILERVPAAGALQRLEPLRARLARNPQDLTSATTLARSYLDLGRTNADPRFVSYAQATLAPWLGRPSVDTGVLVLSATAAQYLHNFDAALTLLDKVLAQEPQNAQAWLIKTTILQVQGRFEAAREACRPLARLSGQLIALTCLSGVNSLTGRLASSYAALRSVYEDDRRIPTAVRTWILGELADMALRSGDERAADADLTTALRASPEDPFIKAQYADLLLREHREREVIQLLSADTQQDNLLLRLAIAGSRLRSPRARTWSEAFQSRYEAARRDGDFTHLREQARFLLEVRGDARASLALAQDNWRVQREPDDVRVYLAAANAARDPQAAHPVLEWIRQVGYEDRTLDTDGLIGRASRP